MAIGSALFKVAAKLIIRPLGAVPIIIDATIGSGLHMEWTVHKSSTASLDTATITVFNMDLSIRGIIASLAKQPGDIDLELGIGWLGLAPVPGALGVHTTIFKGEDDGIVIERYTGLNILSIFECVSGLHTMPAPAGGAIAGLTIQGFIAEIVQKTMGYPMSPLAVTAITEAATKAPLPFQLSFEGDPRDILDDLMASIGLSWGIQDGVFVVYRGGLIVGQPPVFLSSQTGLLDHSVRDDGGVEFEALAIGSVNPGSQIQILGLKPGPTGQPVPAGGLHTLRVEHVTFEGTSDGPSLMHGLARPLQVL